MALTDHRPPQPTTGMPCSVASLIAKLDGEERDYFLTEMLGTRDEPGWTAPAIYDAVRAEGHEIGLQSINRHRGEKCRCYRTAA